MSATYFVDTNLLVYARDSSESQKQPIAKDWLDRLWSQRCGRLSIQVLNEYFVTVTRKLTPGLNEDAAWSDVEDLLTWDPVPVDSHVLRRARELAMRYALSWWDAQIVAAAQLCGAERLLTEDLQDGQDMDGLVVINPFHRSPDEELGTRPTGAE